MQINKRKQLVIGATALGALVASATTAHAEVNRRVEKIPFKTETREDPTLPKGERKVIQQGVEGEKEIVTTTTADVPGQAGTANGQVSFTTKAAVTTSNEIKPRSIFAIIDNSGSVNGGNDSRIKSSFIPLLQTMGPNDQIQIATYGVNQATSYFSNGANDRERMVTKMMNRDEFAKFVEEVLSPKTGTTREAILNQKLVYDFKGVKQSGSSYEFEDIFDAARNKDYTPVVMQFTDSWEYEEEIDSSFAEWSKAHAKTFMSVIYGSGRAQVAMKKAGHPNIFLAQGEFTTDSDQTKKVLEQIKATTTEVVKKGANQTVNVSIGGQGVTVTKATLKGAVTKDLPIKDGKVEFSEALPDGSYTLDYEAKGSGTLKSVVAVDGKEVGNKTVELKGTSGQKGETKTVENIIKQPVNEIIAIGTQEAANVTRRTEPIPFKTKEVEDENLNEGVRKVVQKGQEGLREFIKTTTTVGTTQNVPGTAKDTLIFTTKASSTTNTTAKPRKILLALDYSGSFAGDQGQKYVATLAKRVVNSMNPGDEISIIGTATTWDWLQDEWTSNIIPITGDKAKLLDFIDHPKNYKYKGEKVKDLNTFMKAVGYNGEYKDFTVVSLIDDTGFTINEGVDKSFQYPILKDFVSKGGTVLGYIPAVGDKKNGDLDITENTMKKIGAKHIEYIDYKDGQNAEATADKLVKSLTEQTVVTVKGGDQKVTITATGKGASIIQAKLKTATGDQLVPVDKGQFQYTKTLPDGTYTLEVEASGDGTVDVVVTVDGKEVSKKTLTVKGSNQTVTTGGEPVLTKESTAVKNADGTYTQKIQVVSTPKAGGTTGITGSFSIDGTKGAFQLTDVKLLDPNGKEVPMKNTGDNNPYGFDIPGTYTLVYSFKPQKAGDIKGTFTIGDKTITKTDVFTVPEAKTTSNETSRVIKEPVDEIVHVGIGGTVTESKKEPIPFATEIIEDEAMMEGEEKVTVEGMTGEKEILTTYKTKKGQKVGNPISTSEHVTKHMRTKIVHRGVKGSVTEKENVELPYTTKIVEDDTLPLGEQKVVQAGVKGNKEITRTWTTQRKLKVGDPTTSEKVTKEPVEEIIHVGTREGVMDTEYEVIPYETHYVDDPTLEAGKEVVVVEGVNGQKAINKFYSLAKGKVVSEIDAQTHILRHPTDKVIHRGTGVKPEAPKVEEPKVETPKVETPTVETPKVEEPKVETPKVEEPKVETPKVEPKVETPKVEPKVETPKVETPKVETPKVETPKVETPKVEPKVEEPKVEPKVETPNVEPKAETPKVEPKAETPKVEKQTQSAKELPKTGDAGMLTSLFGIGSIALGGLSVRRKRRK